MNPGTLRNIRVEGLGLTDDFLLGLAERTTARGQVDPLSYGLAHKEPVEEAISRSWDRLRKAYARWTEARTGKGRTDAQGYWITPLLQELGHTNLTAQPHLVIEDKTYPVSFLGTVPIQVTPGEDLDRIGQRGQLRASPHGLLQEYLNRTADHLWGLVTNGEKLRLLRDNAQVTRPAFVQFDLEEIFDQGDSAAFRVLWLLAHQTRFQGGADSPIETWNKAAEVQGTRANDLLRDGVARAIELLGAGFVKRNRSLRDGLASGELDAQDLYRQALKIVYQLVFTFVIEDRNLLHPEDTDPVARTRFEHYSTRRLRQIAGMTEGSSTHIDAWEGVKVLLGGMYGGLPFIGVPAFGGHLFEDHPLLHLELGNSDLYRAVKALSLIQQGGTTRTVNYAGLDAEELGSIYESLLELHPEIDTHTGTFTLGTAAGNERKTTGSYYTPSSLIELLLESALDPVIEEALQKPDPVAALKALKVIDPACGSGHFILAAARRIGLALARTEHDVAHPSPDQLRHATRTVIAHCIYGVDINPMAIDLAKVALWLESAVPGKPLAFLDHRLKVGNSLLGITAEGMNLTETLKDTTRARTHDKFTEVRILGLPDDAFTALEGDDKKTVTELKKRNKAERQQQAMLAMGQQMLFGPAEDLSPLTSMMQALDKIEPDDLSSVQAQESTYRAIQDHAQLKNRKLLADAWCAAFVTPKTPGSPEISTLTLNALKANPDAASLAGVRDLVTSTAQQYKFLHPHVEFPDVFTGEDGGFDCVLGNPPWERIKLQEKEWFAQRVPEIAAAPNAAARTRKINELKAEQPAIHAAFHRDVRQAEGESHFIRSSGRYKLTGRGDVNTYAIFSELSRDSLNPHGRMGIIVPTGIATDDTTKFFFQDLIAQKSLIKFLSFENERFIFPGVHHAFKFCLLMLSGTASEQEKADFIFFARYIEDVANSAKVFTLSAEEIALLNPNTRTAPVFRNSRDAAITKGIYSRVPVLMNEATEENPWGVKFMRMFDMSNDSELFHTAEHLDVDSWTLDGNRYRKGDEVMLPLYEAKLMHQFDHRYATYTENGDTRDMTPTEKADPSRLPVPRYWVAEREVSRALAARLGRDWLIACRWISNATNERTYIAQVAPVVGYGNSAPLILSSRPVYELAALTANLNTIVFDYSVRQKMGGTNMTFGLTYQFPVLPPSVLTTERLDFITSRVLELTYTAYDLTGFARDLGYKGEPFIWDDERRLWLRAELDALYFHLYGIDREDVEYIMETFPIVKRKDEAKYGSYRTKEAILSVYDELAQVGVEHYQSRLPIPPADPRAAHSAQEPVQAH